MRKKNIIEKFKHFWFVLFSIPFLMPFLLLFFVFFDFFFFFQTHFYYWTWRLKSSFLFYSQIHSYLIMTEIISLYFHTYLWLSFFIHKTKYPWSMDGFWWFFSNHVIYFNWKYFHFSFWRDNLALNEVLMTFWRWNCFDFNQVSK